ncbi:RimK/LysX family protein [Candidatus Saccharibacteria bacterium]|nr:RimK/LysX family protein [Candidatus Saccharibacteria bacterium]
MTDTREKVTIGRTEYVWLVATRQKKIPARIDTGARTTAIWASDISETNGVLTWKFFAPGSEFFTGEICKTNKFEERIVMSSTGHQEVRYLVPIVLQMKKRRVRTFCTLADRAHATFPILIGRNTLMGKFIVDVSHSSRRLNELDDAGFNKLQNDLRGEDL